jgi:hypothetical protein
MFRRKNYLPNGEFVELELLLHDALLIFLTLACADDQIVSVDKFETQDVDLRGKFEKAPLTSLNIQTSNSKATVRDFKRSKDCAANPFNVNVSLKTL